MQYRCDSPIRSDWTVGLTSLTLIFIQLSILEELSRPQGVTLGSQSARSFGIMVTRVHACVPLCSALPRRPLSRRFPISVDITPWQTHSFSLTHLEDGAHAPSLWTSHVYSCIRYVEIFNSCCSDSRDNYNKSNINFPASGWLWDFKDGVFS